MKKVTKIVVLILCISMFCCGCTKAEGRTYNEDTKIPINENSIVVGVSQVGSESVWRSANTLSIQSVFTKDNGYFLIFDNARQKQENQMKAIRNFISLQVDYIVLSPITEDGWETILKEAKDADIPVILMDRKVDVSDPSLYTSWVGADFYAEGKKAGRWLADYLNSKGRGNEEINIVVLQGTQGATSQIGRTNGFESIRKKHRNWNLLEQVDAEYTTAKGKEEMQRMLKKYNDIDVVISQNDDMTFGALEAINKAGKKTGVDGDIIIISFDAVKRALEFVEKGIINVDIECNPNQAQKVSDVIMRLEKSKSVQKEYFVDEMVFTPENVSEYMDRRTY